jgi:hypothetical protein
MSVTGYLVALGFIAACAGALWLVLRLARARGAPNRESIERMRIQGNFVPMNAQGRAEDEQRKALHASGKGGLPAKVRHRRST